MPPSQAALTLLATPALSLADHYAVTLDLGTLTSASSSAVLTLPGFDDDQGARQLESVTFSLGASTTLEYAFENPHPDPWLINDVYATFATSVALTLGHALQTPDVGMHSGLIPLAPADGAPGAGDDFSTFGVDGYPLGASLTLTDPASLDAFHSGDPGIAIVNAASLAVFDGVGDTFAGQDFAQTGALTLTFTYVSIPEPGAASLASLAIAGAVLRRRRAS